MYISQDPIRLAGNNPTLYGYVKDVNSWVDVWGLDCKKKIVLGEGMDRVKDFARKNDAKWYQAWKKNFPNRKMTPDELSKSLKRNERWLKKKIKDGYEIIDIGIDPSRSSRSPFYQIEQQIITDMQSNGLIINITRI
jgi:hypothetical protein